MTSVAFKNGPAAVAVGPASPVVVARVVKPIGLKGAVRVEAMSDAPDRFTAGARFWVLSTPPVRVTLAEAAGAPDGRLVLRFEGRESIDAVSAWRGCFLAIEESERAPLPDGAFYHDELKGMSVETEAGILVGVVRDVLSAGPYDLLAIEDGAQERLLPMVKAFVIRLDRALRRVTVRPPAGWLD
ncbi:MAG TPA: ribosome maturation factor RimM [Nitrospiria bacterium]|nr:ribosome maturation factor RimM [Nitrospiria bacterium]